MISIWCTKTVADHKLLTSDLNGRLVDVGMASKWSKTGHVVSHKNWPKQLSPESENSEEMDV